MRVVTFGEAMLRFSPPPGSSLERAERYDVEVGGAEANVAVALARLGIETAWVSRLPRNALGRRVAASLAGHGVDTAQLIWTEEGRVGLYFVEMGPPPRPWHVIYDRADSSFAALRLEELDPTMLDGATILHVTGITPALSAGCRAATDVLVQAAHDRGVAVSCDVNYRSKLWDAAEARRTLGRILPLARFLFLSSADAATVLQVDQAPPDQVQELGRRYPQATVVLTCGEEGAYAWDGALHYVPAVPGVEIDRLGRGDAFCAGYLFGQHEAGTDFGLACGAALASLAQTYAGDSAWITREDVLLLAGGKDQGRYR